METSKDESIMSDTTVLVTVEELINRAMGPSDTNVVNYKLIKMILQIMARQLRIMQQRIEVKSTELKEELMKKRKMKVSTEKGHSLLARTHIAAKIRRKSTQKYKTKASNGTTSSEETATEDLPESDKENKLKDKREKELQKNEDKNEKKTANQMQKQTKKLDKAEVLVGKTKYEEELEELKEIVKHKACETMAQEGQKILEKQVLDATAEHKEGLDIKDSGEKYEGAPESMIEKVVETESSEARIEITEKHVNDEKILVVAKGPPISLEGRSRSCFELVTESQFAIVEAEIGKLISREFPKSVTLPENQKLMNDIRKGEAKLPEVMQILQIEERMKLAEESMTKIVSLLTAFASAGALPTDIAEQLGTLIISSTLEEDEKPTLVENNSSVSKPSTTSTPSTASKPSTAETENPLSTIPKFPCVTHKDLSAQLKNLKNDFSKILGKIMKKPTGMVKSAQWIVKDVAEKIEVAQNLHGRVSELSSLVVHHNERFTGFESSLTTLMESIGRHLAEFRRLVESGIDKCTINFNAEAEAVMKLKQRYEDLEKKLEEILFKHKALTVRQTDLKKEIHTLIERIERMQEEKSNDDEFRDQLQNKVDRSQLTGILRGTDFSEVCVDFQRRIDECHEIFNRSDATWAAIVNDIKHTKESKADFVELLATRDLVEKQLRDLDSKIRITSAMLGDPEIALQSRKLALGAICGSCHEPARVEPYDVRKGAPPRLPALGKPPVEVPKEQLIPDWVTAGQPLHRLCHRWCGGSHTTVQDSSKRMQLKIHLQALPTRKFTDYGDDGRLYMLEEELQPCIECNALDGEKTPDHEPVDDHLGSEACSCPLVQ